MQKALLHPAFRLSLSIFGLLAGLLLTPLSAKAQACPPPGSVLSVLLSPEHYTPAQVQKARALYAARGSAVLNKQVARVSTRKTPPAPDAKAGTGSPQRETTKASYAPDLVIIKYKSAASALHPKARESALAKAAQSSGMRAMFPQHQQARRLSNGSEASPSRLAGFYLMEVPVGTDIPALCQQLSREENIAYAEPYYLMEPLLVPDDPEAKTGGRQDYLDIINAYEAWDISRGDAGTFIAVIDAGFEVNHPDMLGNRYYHTADPINGIDDDGDGYTDTYAGYDLADNDTDVDAGPDPHGLEVAGISSAHTDNGIGVAGLAFDSPYYPLKVFRNSDNSFNRGYEAIVLAADLGAAVINLSWGGQGTGSQTLQEVINYAVLDRDVVVVAAAGNTGTEATFFPASYDNILSVGASNDDDTKASFSTFSRYIDLLAPGNAIYSTRAGSSYGNVGGTSFSAPMVSAAAALLRSAEPELSAVEVMERIRVSADDIYGVGSNASYQYKLGKGRLNMEAALSRKDIPSLRLASVDFNSSFGNLVFSNDTVALDLSFINYLADAGASTITLRALNENVSLPDSVISLSGINHNQTLAAGKTLHFYLGPDVEPGTQLEFLVLYESGSYTDYEYFDVPVVPDWLNFPGGDLLMTVSSHGNLGYEMDSLVNGLGITRGGGTLLTFAGMGIALDSNRVADNMPRSQDSLFYDADFVKEENIRLWNNSLAANDARSTYYDVASAEREALGITVEQSVLSYEGEGDWIITEFRVINSGTDTLIKPAIGVYADWNVGNSDNNRMESLAGRRMAYVWNGIDSTTFAGISLLTRSTAIINGIELPAPGSRNFDDASKYAYLSGVQETASAGMSGDGADVAFFLSAKADTLYPGASTRMAFAWLAADDLNSLIADRDRAQALYDAYRASPPRLDTVAVCAGQESHIFPQEGGLWAFYSDAAGDSLLATGLSLDAGILLSDTLFYARNLDGNYAGDIRSLPLRVQETRTAILASSDTLYLDDQPQNSIVFSTADDGAVTWEWTFSNGFGSTQAAPEIVFEAAGSYTATVYTATALGCLDTATYALTVLARPGAPLVRDTSLCAGTSLRIDPDNAELIRVYDAASGGTILYEGLVFETGAISTDQKYYFSRFAADGTESLRAAMQVKVSAPEAGIAVIQDTLDLSDPGLLFLQATGAGISSLSWDLGNGERGSDNPQALSYASTGRYRVVLSARDSLSCETVENLELVVARGSAPAPVDTLVCAGSTLLLGSEAVYHYYPADGSSLLHKGRSLLLRDLRADTSFMVASNAAFAESEKVLYQINIDPFAVQIRTTPDTVIWEERSITVTARFEGTGVASWEWLVADLNRGQVDPLSIAVDGPGTQLIRLIAMSDRGCVDTAGYALLSTEVTALPADALAAGWQLWPNPGKGSFYLLAPEGSTPLGGIGLLNAAGQELEVLHPLWEGKGYLLQLEQYPAGLYFIRLGSAFSPLRLLISR